jgi:hypothetical protein
MKKKIEPKKAEAKKPIAVAKKEVKKVEPKKAEAKKPIAVVKKEVKKVEPKKTEAKKTVVAKKKSTKKQEIKSTEFGFGLSNGKNAVTLSLVSGIGISLNEVKFVFENLIEYISSGDAQRQATCYIKPVVKLKKK